MPILGTHITLDPADGSNVNRKNLVSLKKLGVVGRKRLPKSPPPQAQTLQPYKNQSNSKKFPIWVILIYLLALVKK